MEAIYDFAVIGAGMAGASVSARLAMTARVALLEMEDQPGYHSTGRSAASWIENYGNEAIIKLNRASFGFLNDPPEQFLDSGVLKPRGVLWTALPGDEAALIAGLKNGVVQITPERAGEMVPAIAADNGGTFAWEAEAYDIDVDRLHAACLRQLAREGGSLLCRSEAVKIERQDGVWHITTKSGDIVRAAVIVNAAGAWADNVATLAGVQPVGLIPYRRSAAMIDVPDEYDVTTWPMVLEVNEVFYFRPDGGRLMLSPADETAVEPHDAWADDMAIAQAADAFAKVMRFDVTRVSHTWGGLRTFTSDRTPVVGMDEVNGFFWLAGQGGYGIQTSPALGSLAASLLLDAPLDDELVAQQFDSAVLSPGRLGDS